MMLDKIHLLNPNCLHPARNLGHPVTFFFYLALFAVCTVFTVMTYWRYNSVTVLNLVVTTRTISNWLWIAYFGIAAVRGLLNSVVYGDLRIHEDNKFNKEVYIADGVLKALQLYTATFFWRFAKLQYNNSSSTIKGNNRK